MAEAARITRFRRVRPIAAGLALLLPLSGWGCAGSSSTTVATLPPPNFNGPLIATPPPAPRPVQVSNSAPRPAAVASNNTATGPRDWTPSARANNWRWIVIHHSATPAGNAARFDKMHKDKGWDELGYHFVIGNGTDSGDGAVEVGPRWRKQKWGAHAKTADNRYNDYGIGICLVGNFDHERPTARQLQSLGRLVAFLMQNYGISPDRVIGHNDTGRATECPGTYLNVAHVRRVAQQQLAGADAGSGSGTKGAPNDPAAPAPADPGPITAFAELLIEQPGH